MGVCGNCGKEGATATCSRCKSVTYCSRDCQLSNFQDHKKECKRIAKERAAASQVPPLVDEWGLTRVNDALVERLKVQCTGLSDEATDKAVYLACNNGNTNHEAMAFLLLFPYGTGFYGARNDDTLFAEYVDHLLKLSTGAFLKNMQWIAYVVRVTATIRAVRGGGPPNSDQELSAEDKKALARLCAALDQRTFSLRYLVGDENALWLLMMHIRDMQTSQQEA